MGFFFQRRKISLALATIHLDDAIIPVHIDIFEAKSVKNVSCGGNSTIFTLNNGDSYFAGDSSSEFSPGIKFFKNGTRTNENCALEVIRSSRNEWKNVYNVVDFILYVDKEGTVYVTPTDSSKEEYVPLKVPWHRREEIKRFESIKNGHELLVLLESGDLYYTNPRNLRNSPFFNSISFFRLKSDRNTPRIVDIRSGEMYLQLLSDRGRAYALGEIREVSHRDDAIHKFLRKNTRLKDHADVEVLNNGKKVMTIGCGYISGYFCDFHGATFGKGQNTKGQLNSENTMLLRYRKIIEGKSIMQIEGNCLTTYFITENGEVWACGENDVGQIPNGTTANGVHSIVRMLPEFELKRKKIENSFNFIEMKERLEFLTGTTPVMDLFLSAATPATM